MPSASIVRNQILLDVQGGDVLMQIFTACILQRGPGEEAPFLEFIQRLCKLCPAGAADATSCRPTGEVQGVAAAQARLDAYKAAALEAGLAPPPPPPAPRPAPIIRPG